MAYRDPIPSQDPNPSPEERDEQAAYILGRMARRVSVVDIAKEMGLNRDTVYERLKLINRQMPPRESLRRILFERHDQLHDRLLTRLEKAVAEDKITHADYVKFTAEARLITAAMASLAVGTDEPDPDPEGDEPVEDWEAGES